MTKKPYDEHKDERNYKHKNGKAYRAAMRERQRERHDKARPSDAVADGWHSTLVKIRIEMRLTANRLELAGE